MKSTTTMRTFIMSASFYIPFGWVHWHDVAVISVSSIDRLERHLRTWEQAKWLKRWQSVRNPGCQHGGNLPDVTLPQDQWQVLLTWINDFIRNGVSGFGYSTWEIVSVNIGLVLFKRPKEESKFWKEGSTTLPFFCENCNGGYSPTCVLVYKG